MEIKKEPPLRSLVALTRTVTKILGFRRAAFTHSGKLDRDFDNPNLKYKLGKCPSSVCDSDLCDYAKGKEKLPPKKPEVEFELLFADIFSSISAIKVSYAQLQAAELTYDPEIIQAADQVVVSELNRLSELKQSCFTKQQFRDCPTIDFQSLPSTILEAQLREQRNLLKTYQIITRKLESDIQNKDDEISSLQVKLKDSERCNRSLEFHTRPATHFFPDVRLHSLDTTHFLPAFRSSVKSIKNFIKQMEHEMESTGWDLDLAARTIQPEVTGKPEHRTHAFESFVCQRMFTDFQHPDYGVSSHDGRSFIDRQRFFNKFIGLRSGKLRQAEVGELASFIRTKYLSLVHPEMEASFFGDLGERAAISSGEAFPASQFFALFADMARKLWSLHCLCFAYGTETAASIFQVKRGCRFSEVYMEIGASPETSSPSETRVAFTVVPGFKLGKTVIQCKVYLSNGKPNGRSSCGCDPMKAGLNT